MHVRAFSCSDQAICKSLWSLSPVNSSKRRFITAYFFKDDRYLLKAGQFAELPHGRYELRIPGDEDALFVMVYELPRPGTAEWDRAVEGEE